MNLLGFLIEVLTIELVNNLIVRTCRYLKSVIPLISNKYLILIAFNLLLLLHILVPWSLHFEHLFPERFRTAFHFKLHELFGLSASIV